MREQLEAAQAEADALLRHASAAAQEADARLAEATVAEAAAAEAAAALASQQETLRRREVLYQLQPMSQQ